MNLHQNIVRIKAVYRALGDLAGDVIFVGGATVALYADRPATDVRPTDDVDIVVEVAGYVGYAALESRLREKGFVNDQASGIICRYSIRGIIVDVMPTAKDILGFSNKWYADAFQYSEEIQLDEYKLKIFSAPFFIATKLEAFKGRGNGDGRTSSDFEDIIFLLNNRTTIWDEMNEASHELKAYLQDECKALLENPNIQEWISAHLDFTEQRRLSFILGGLYAFTNFENG